MYPISSIFDMTFFNVLLFVVEGYYNEVIFVGCEVDKSRVV